MKKKRVCRQCKLLLPPYKERKQTICELCAEANLFDSIQQMQTKEGPFYEKWLRNRQAAAGRFLEEGNG